jgi:hypothetical protein
MKIQIPESMSGFNTLRIIEEHLFEQNNPELSSRFFRQAKAETVVYKDNENSCGWSGHDKTKVVNLAKEYGVEVELIK